MMKANVFAIALLTVLMALVGIGAAVQPALAQVDAWIDPGHGGKDPGALGIDGAAAPNERDFNLDVSAIVESRLGEIGWLALLTRNSDIYWTKTRRTQIAAGERPNDVGDQELGSCCVSVHMNSVKDTTVFGTKVIFPKEKLYAKSRRAYGPDSSLGAYIYPALLSNTPVAFMGCNRGLGLTRDVRELTVLRKSKIPTALVECCLISNRCQFNHISVQGNQALVANGIATGIANFLGAQVALRNQAPKAVWRQAAPYTFTAPAAIRPVHTLSAALQEGFEGGTFPPPGWTIMSSGASQPYTWHRTTDSIYVAVGSGAAAVQGGSTGPVDEWLISPMIHVSTADSTLRFRWLSNPLWSSAANAHCSVKRKSESTWTDVWTLQQEPQAVSFQYPSRVVSLTPWVGDSVQVAFRINGTGGPDLAIDDISTGVFSLTAPPVNDLCSAAIQLPAGSFLVTGSTCYATNNRNPFPADSSVSSCVPDDASGGDVFYKLNALSSDTLSVTATDNCTYHPLLYLLNSCDSLTATCVAGQGDADSDEAPAFQYVFQSAGTYYLAVDAIADECGSFELACTFRGSVTGVTPETPSGASRLRLTAAPNPSTGAISFSAAAPAKTSGVGMLRFFDPSGRLVLARPIAFAAGRGSVHWDGRDDAGSTLPPGLYLAVCELEGERVTLRVTVMR